MTASLKSPDGTEPSTGRHRVATWLVNLGIFLLGFMAMHLLYAGSVGPGEEIGVPGHDSFYHITMASILPDVGAMPEFPWLEFVYFRDEGDAFVSHHWGFHLILLPFVKAAEAIRGDALAGGRWATSAMFGLNLLLFFSILRARRVPWPWLWLGLFFLLPDQFYARHGFVRAIGPSLLFMQLILLGLFTRRTWLAALGVGAYVHLYLGAVMFGPLLVATWAFSTAVGRPEDRRLPVRMVLVTAGAWLLGVVTYPYAGGIFEFLRLQVFGTGLSPDIEVGREWKPYSDAWFLVRMAAPLLTVWAVALFLRLRMGPRLDAEETTLLILNLAFLVLTVKARRFIEYWSPMCLLSAATLASVPLAELLRGTRSWIATRSDALRERVPVGLLVVLAAAVVVAWVRAIRTEDAGWFLQEWLLWATPVALIVAGVALAGAATRAGDGPAASRPRRLVTTVLVALFLPGATLAVGASGLRSASKQLDCYYDLDELRSMMAFLEDDSAEGDVIFTDDWDVFPPFFYFNRHNHYIVGLDPMFTYDRKPDLWNRYVKISRGQVPSTIRLVGATDDDARAAVGLEDIREEFGARYVIADRDHRALSNALLDAPGLARLVYPTIDPDDARDAPYLVFRILERGEGVAPIADGTRPVWLSDLRPVTISQGWGDLVFDRSVDRNRIRLDDITYPRGLGTHAPSRILYDVPPGYAWFEATVGIDDETDGNGSTVASVLLDGRTAYESPRLEGGGAVAHVRVALDGARQIQLEADPTGDGQRFDHVSWGNPRLVPAERTEADAGSSVGGTASDGRTE